MVDYGIGMSKYGSICVHLTSRKAFRYFDKRCLQPHLYGLKANGWTIVLAPENLATWDVGDD